MKLTGSMTFSAWQEKDLVQLPEGKKTTQASVKFIWTGDLMAQAAVEYAMYYHAFDPADPLSAQADYVGLLLVESQGPTLQGSFALEDRGLFAQGRAISQLKVIPGSGLGDFAGVSGQGRYDAGHQDAKWELELEGIQG